MTFSPKHLILAYYHFAAIPAPQEEVVAHKTFFDGRNVKGRIYLSEQGINGQMSASENDACAYMEWMQRRAPFQGMPFKIQEYHEHAFPKLTVKYRKQLVALDADVNLSKYGQHVSPQCWKEMLESNEGHVLLDVRNDYEWKVGRFKGAKLPPCQTFREFREYADKLKNSVDPKKTPVMMYCTGGIRCELYSSLLKEKGFERVYQLEGGVLNYGNTVGTKHWLGKLFVFDDRLTTEICKEKTKVIGTCHHCGAPNETYYNCANVDCNALFLCCGTCLPKFRGCCQESCQNAPRVRLWTMDRNEPKWA